MTQPQTLGPQTLGDVLDARKGQDTDPPRSRSFLFGAVNVLILTALTLLPVWWFIAQPENAVPLVFAALGLGALWAILSWQGRPRRGKRAAPHFLLAGDQQGFMADLRLDAKTAVIDGSNLYHFGLGERIGPRAVQLIAQQLRADGYRVVCFFDANIFYTLIENGAMTRDQHHAIYTLGQVFGLEYSEIYVVPSGVQADRYVLSTLKHLPISFAVTNDRFRDYGKLYGDVMANNDWRKGVEVKGNELRLHHFRFETPIRLNEG